jgi:filamentous hemagglutinin family protein
MNTRGRSGKNDRTACVEATNFTHFRLAPIARAIALTLAAGGMIGNAYAVQPFSAAWFANKGAIQNTVAATGLLPNGQPVSSLNPNSQVSQAAAQTQKSIADLGLAARRIALLQQAAHPAAAGNASNIPDGLGAGGLDKDTNSLTQSWINAQDATQTVDANGNVVVNIKQTDAKSILSWQSFNIGQHTTLNFDQSGGTQANGTNDWVVLNRVNNPNTAPSQILGSIKAQGSVYVLDRNGIMFGSGSQINVGSLVASSLNLFSNDLADSNKRFMNGGIGDLNATNVAANSILLTSLGTDPIAGDVTIAPGAEITMGDHGLALIAAPNVSNSGTITAPDGQIALVAGIGVSYDYNKTSFAPGSGSSAQGTNDNSTTMLRFANYGALIDASGNDITPVGDLLNDGLIYTPRGNITLLGGAIQQNGAVVATTSVAQPGSIVITSLYEVGVHPGSANPADEFDTNFYTGAISFGPQAVTAILADANGATIPSDTTSLAPFQTPQGAANFNSALPTQGLGIIDIIGQAVDMQSGGLLYAPGQTVSVSAVALQDPRASVPAVAGSGRVLLDSGATIDVAGLADIELAMSSNLLTVRLSGNELADSPLQQAGFLDNLLVTVDMNDSGINPETGEAWVGTPLANLTSYEDLVQRSINQLLVNGGAVYLSGNEVDGAPDSTINLMGGYLHYLGGMVKTTRLLDQFGNPVSIGQADPNDTFTGIAGQFIQNHPRWGVTEIFSNPLIDRAVYVDDYVQGGNAGSLNINVTGGVPGSGAAVLDSTLLAGNVVGSRQITADSLPSGGSFNFTGISPIEIANGLALAASTLPADFDMSAPLLASSGTDYQVNIFDGETLSEGDFKNISLTAGGVNSGVVSQSITEDAGAALTVQSSATPVVQPGGTTMLQGGTITLTGNNIAIDGTLTAHGGTINISTQPGGSSAATVPGDIVVGATGVLDVSGFFINDRDIPVDQQVVPLPIDAGTISLTAGVGTNTAAGTSAGPAALDLSGNITLEAGSLLDLRGGGHVGRNGQLLTDQNGVPLGSGGNLTLQTSSWTAEITPAAPLPVHGMLTLDGTIDALGFNGGGTLTLGQTAFQIGGDASTMASYATYFDAGYWGDLGFGSFVLNSMLDSVVPDGATVVLHHQNLLPDFGAIVHAPNGADLGDIADNYASTGFLTGTQRSATNLSVTAGFEQENNNFQLATGGSNDAAIVDQGAQILGDPGASISIASYAMTSILGQIHAPGGAISVSVLPPTTGVGLMTGPLYLGPESVLDASGVIVPDLLAAPVPTVNGLITPVTGDILAGGTVNLSDALTAILVAPGAVIDVSGTAGTMDVLQSTSAGPMLQRTPVWSDAGQVNIKGGAGLLFEGTLLGNAGAPEAAGGTLSLTAADMVGMPSNLILVQDTAQAVADAGVTLDLTTFVPTINGLGTQAIDSLKITRGSVLFGADTLDGSGFDNLVLSDASGSLGFTGSVALNLRSSVVINAAGIMAGNAGNFNWGFQGPNNLPTVGGVASTLGASLTIDAPYVAINGFNGSISSSPNARPLQTADATLTVNAGQIDLSAYSFLENIGLATFNSDGDIRLLPAQYISQNWGLSGYLLTTGNLAFNAADIYPVSGTTFVIQAAPFSPAAAPTSITFGYSASGPSNQTPLSAGATLIVAAGDIVQNGELRAPFGSIVLGVTSNDAIAKALGTSQGPATTTDSVVLGSGSITSVSADGAIIPYGNTVDQSSWMFNPQAANPDWANQNSTQSIFTTPLTQAPQGVVTLNGASVAFQPGAVVDISGGGDLQAQEWIPGTGGSRDVLSQFNTSFAASKTGTRVALFQQDQNPRQVYAIVPGYSSKLAAYDPTISQDGVIAGRQIYLAGGPGLPAGYYTLLPGKYATLPGAFRVVVNAGVSNPASNQTYTLPDGTMEMTGYFGNGFTGARDASTSQFMVQSQAVWGRYSQYVTTSANTFFPNYAALNNQATPTIPVDAGRLVLSAKTGLTLGGTLKGDAGAGGAGSQVDISSQFIEITGGANQSVDAGYLGIDASALDSLGASSLLIGGTRAMTAAGTVITPTANGVIVANDASDPLSGPEILLVAAPQFQSSAITIDNQRDTATVLTPIADTGLVTIRGGAVVEATGAATADQPTHFIMGSTLSNLLTLPDSVVSSASLNNGATIGTAELITDYYKTLSAALGTMIEVSNGTPDTLQLPSQAQLSPGAINVTDNVNPQGADMTVNLPSLAGLGGTGAMIESGAQVSGGNALTLASTGDVDVQSGATISGANISAISSSITFVGADSGTVGSTPAPTSGMVIDADIMAELEQAQNLNLQSYGAISFQGDVDFSMSSNDAQVTLGGGSLSGDGGQVSIEASTLVLDNTLNAAAVPGAGTGSLSIDVGQLIFGAGDKSVAGFGSVNLVANQAVIGQDTGSMDFGALPITLQTPTVIADTGSTQTIKTSGALSVISTGGDVMNSDALGGAITLQGGSVTVSAPVQAQAGNITLKSTAGDVAITNGGELIAHGVAKQFADTVAYAGGGSITLSADNGTVNVESGALVDFAGAAQGGNGGGLTITTVDSTAAIQLNGTLLGSTAAGYGGSVFNLDSSGAVVLDDLAGIVAGAGVTGGFAVHTAQGDLVLDNTINASQVALTADGGTVRIASGAAITASGTDKIVGEIDLFGGSGVDVEGALTATGSPSSPKQGGLITIGTTGTGSTTSLNATYGYENIDPSASGTIIIGATAAIDAAGGIVTLRAPILDADNADGLNVNVQIASGARISGGAVNLDAYAVWSTADQSTNPDQHFDGIVDPAGWYNNTGTLEAGSFKDFSGNTVANWDGSSLDTSAHDLSYYLANDYFTPNNANADHGIFYAGFDPNSGSFDPANPAVGSLPAFVQQPGFHLGAAFADIANFQARPEIDLLNPAPADGGVNGGNISVLTNWNLGAGVINPDGSRTLAYRYQGTIAPVLMLRAAGDVRISASISDGFFQTADVTLPAGAAAGAPTGAATYDGALNSYNNDLNNGSSITDVVYDDGSSEPVGPVDANVVLSAPQPGGSTLYYQSYQNYLTHLYDDWTNTFVGNNTLFIPITAPVVAAPVAPSPSDPNYGSDYAAYALAYNAWETANFDVGTMNTSGTPTPLTPPAVLSQYANYVTAEAAYIDYGFNTLFDPNALQTLYIYAPVAPSFAAAGGGGSSGGVTSPPPGSANAPSNMPTAADPMPVQFATVVPGQSASYRIVAGASMASANPLALSYAANFAAGSSSGLAGEGNVIIDGHIVYAHPNVSVIAAPTTVRTGTGAIDIAAGGNLELTDTLAPGVIYTAGTISDADDSGNSAASSVALGQNSYASQFAALTGISTVLTPAINPDGGGNITITVAGDIAATQNVTDTLAQALPFGSFLPSGLTGVPGGFIGQYWTSWLLANPAAPGVAWYVNFGSFDQGVMSLGGNVTVKAGGDIHDLGVSLPTTAFFDSDNALHVTGGGTLSVSAGGSIYSGDFYVGKGAGTVKAGGAIAADFSVSGNGETTPVPTLLAVQYGTLDVDARQSADIGGVFDPTYIGGTAAVSSTAASAFSTLVPFFTSMGADSGVAVQSTSGALNFNSLENQAALFTNGSSLLLPASLSLTAIDGDIAIGHGGGLYPSTTGTLTVLADQSVDLVMPLQASAVVGNPNPTFAFPSFDTSGNVSGSLLGKLDFPVGTGILPTAENPELQDVTKMAPSQVHDPAMVQYSGDPVRIVALNGSIVDGAIVTGTSSVAGGGVFVAPNVVGGQITLMPNAPAEIYAGLDILDLPFYGENFDANDITSIIAGRDIGYNVKGNQRPTAIELAGPGTLDVEAGRNINFQTQRVSGTSVPETGIRTIGNTVDTGADPDGVGFLRTSTFPFDFGNPYLPIGGASVSVLFGVGPGMDQAAFINQYVNPANAAITTPASQTALIAFVDQYETAAGNAANAPQTADQAWIIFQTLPDAQQKLLTEQVFDNILDTTGTDFNNPASPFFQQYSRGYQAINILFPASLGYTANGAGSSNGANAPVNTGDFDMRNSTVQTQQGGNISMFGPGGRILVGSSVASPATNPASEGILTLENGSINTFSDGDVLVAQSRVMTEQGGNVVMWSSNGDLDAGKGAKTSVSLPPPLYACDIDFICEADIKGFVSGAGIATLQSLPDVPVGDANLIAPRGTVDAGAAGIRVSGNINIAALEVDNAANIDVQGKATGLPGVAQVNLGDLTNASAVASQAVMAAQDVVHQQQAAARQALPSIFTVRVLGFGNDAAAGESTAPDPQKASEPQASNGLPYNVASPLQFVGMGQDFDPKQVARMNDSERRGLQQGR